MTDFFTLNRGFGQTQIGEGGSDGRNRCNHGYQPKFDWTQEPR